MKYEDPACALCPSAVQACRQGEASDRGPGFCPSKVDPAALETGHAFYFADDETRKVSLESARVEAEGYCKWTRVEEIVQFSKRMGFKKLGIATCIGLMQEASLLSRILESHGFEVVSAACKLGNIPKEEVGLGDHEKVKPGGFEPMCNPVAQAEMLNRHGSEFNIVVGLCLGHDSLFFKYAKGLSTVLIAKDRVLGHNPIAALQFADTYYARVWGPNKPEAPAKKKAAKRGK
ncbi:MAG: DUF1847 domain-containing protein [Rhodomicrobium sp.]